MPAHLVLLSVLAFFLGQTLVTKGCRNGFLVWAVSNVVVAIVHLSQGEMGVALLFAVYSLANVCSLWAWSVREIAGEEEESGRQP